MPLTPFERLLEQQRLPAQPSRALIRREDFYFLRRLAIAGLSLAILMVSGATSYAAFESETWWRGVIRTFETLTTLGPAGTPRSLRRPVDENPDVREDMEEMGVLHVDGRASVDEVLCEAGVMRARAVIACVDSDAENIFVTITARALRPDIEIVARAAEEPTEQKLIRAGANDVVSPYKASGDTMARLALDVPGERERARPVDIDADGRAEGRVAEGLDLGST